MHGDNGRECMLHLEDVGVKGEKVTAKIATQIYLPLCVVSVKNGSIIKISIF